MTEALPEDPNSTRAQGQLGEVVEVDESLADDPGKPAALKDEVAYRTFLEALD